MRIALLTENLAFGGINRYCLDLAEGLQLYPDVNVTLLALGDRSDQWLLQEAAERGIQVEVLPMRSVFDLQAVKQLRRLLIDRQVDILHSQGYRSNMVARLAVRVGWLPTKLICTVHGAYHFSTAPLRSQVYYLLDYLSMGMSDRVIAVSEATLKQLSRWGPQRKTQVIYNGTTMPLLVDLRDQRTSRYALGIPLDAKVVIFVGRFSPQKGIPTFVEVARKTLSTMDEAVFLAVGDGPLISDLKICVQEFGPRMILTGQQRRVSPFYAAADLLILPSRTEGLPMVLIEAFAHGLPAVASSVGGIPEVVKHGINGFLCAPMDAVQMHEQLQHLLIDDDLRRSFGIQARCTIQAGFSLDRMILETHHTYLSLV